LNFFIFNKLMAGMRDAAELAMRIFAITKTGLMALMLSVGTLWICVGFETAIRHRADRETAASMRTLARLRRMTQGSEAPTPVRESVRPFAAPRPFES
jgi:hypothetical protein